MKFANGVSNLNRKKISAVTIAIFSALAECSSPAAPDVGAIQTQAAQQIFATLTAQAPTSPPTTLPAQTLAPKVEPTRAAPPTVTPQPTASLSSAFKKFTNDVQVSIDGAFIILKSNGVPNHPSPYFARTDPRYEAYNGTNPRFRAAANTIREQNLELRIPLNPRKADAPSRTLGGPIGMVLNGVAIFNQYAAGNQPLTDEINGFDQYNGHPQQEGMYHYHIEPLYLTKNFGKDALVGFLLDGFPLYGPVENGKTLTSADLDAFHGHAHATVDFPQGIYHYHTTADAPYINGNNYYGNPGRWVGAPGGQGQPPQGQPQPKDSPPPRP
ncbi:MAG: YHYH protein [Chloroflexi bacterium]|nr:YHYH protein [Chloroflexota bacterium]